MSNFFLETNVVVGLASGSKKLAMAYLSDPWLPVDRFRCQVVGRGFITKTAFSLVGN
jgi:hypothetical protein